MSTTIFDKVKTHLDESRAVQFYDLVLSFHGTYGKKRKADRQTIHGVKRFNAVDLWEKTNEQVNQTIKEETESAIINQKIKTSRGLVYARLSGLSVEGGSTRSDSNLMMHAPTFKIDLVNNTIEAIKSNGFKYSPKTITPKMVALVKKHNAKTWHDQEWHEFNNLRTTEAINYAIYRVDKSDSLEKFYEHAEYFMFHTEKEGRK